MKRNAIFAGALAVLAAGGLTAAAVWNWALGPTLDASGAITAIPIAVTVESAAEGTALPATLAAPAEAVATAEAEPTDAAGGELTVLQISQDASQVRFILTEELRGQPVTVVGASNQVAGEIALDPADLSTAQVGVIQVNARTLLTDSDQRNQAIRNRILNTDSYEYITFAPTAVLGLQGGLVAGETYAFQIAGDLTVRGVTQPVVFDVSATAGAGDELAGTAAATIQWSDFGVAIPNVPFVANVSEDVRLELDFVAGAA